MCDEIDRKRPSFGKSIRNDVIKKNDGKCWHCKIDITDIKWDVDHYPVKFKDIRHQWVIGITDPKDINNLVPSCVKCNRSHKFEKSYCIYGGRSQCKCEKICTIKIILYIFILIIYTLLIYILTKRLC